MSVYITWGNDPGTSLIITWQTASNEGTTTLEYRPQGTDAWLTASSTTRKSPGTGYLSEVTLTGLEPGTAYEYRIAGSDKTHITHTAQQGPFDFSFVYFCDTGLIGRPDGLTTGTARVRDAVCNDNPLFVLGGGDYAYGNKDGRYAVMTDAGDEWFRQWQPMLTRFPFLPQYGNHEIFLDERFEEWVPRFAYPKDYRDGRCYGFDVGDVHFSAFFAPESKSMPDDQDLAWLDADLADARSRGVHWLIVYQHAPIYGFGVSHPSTTEMRDLLAPIFDKYAVDLVLTGHDQSYERTFPLRHDGSTPQIISTDIESYTQGEGTIYAKISPAGKKSEIPRDFSRFTVDQQPFMALRDDNHHHYALVHVRASGELEFIGYSLPDTNGDRVILDRFVIRSAS